MLDLPERQVWKTEAFREFLCRAMNLLPEISCMFSGEKKSICFTNYPSSVTGNHYFEVGQLVGLSY